MLGDPEYRYQEASDPSTAPYLWPPIERLIVQALSGVAKPARVLDLGAGNGAFAARLSSLGVSVTAVEPSSSGVEIARQTHPQLTVIQASAYDDLTWLGQYSVVTCLEVIEHCYFPRRLIAGIRSLLEPDGTAIVSTPYHGYWKNLALAVSGQMDAHFTALWDHGHIKFWSVQTLSSVLTEGGFNEISVLRIGRVPVLAKSMIAVAKP